MTWPPSAPSRSRTPARRPAPWPSCTDPTDGIEAFTHGDGTTATRTWTWNGPDDIWTGDLDQAEHPDWAAATDDFATRTGIPLA